MQGQGGNEEFVFFKLSGLYSWRVSCELVIKGALSAPAHTAILAAS